MQDGDEVCGCNGVSKGQIVKAVKEQGLFTVDDVKKCTKAASSCGGCSALVKQVMNAELEKMQKEALEQARRNSEAPKLRPYEGDWVYQRTTDHDPLTIMGIWREKQIRVWSFKFLWVTLSSGRWSMSTQKPWFCDVISTLPVVRSFTGWFAPRWP